MPTTDVLLKRRKLAVAIGLSLLVHLSVGLAIWGKRNAPVYVPEGAPVVLVELEPPPPLPVEVEEPVAAGEATETPLQEAWTEAAAKAPVVTPKVQTAPAIESHKTPTPVLPTEVVQISAGSDVPAMRLLGEGEMAGALVAGSGAGGGSGEGGSGGGGAGGAGGACDMVGRLQALVRRDARIQSVVRDMHRQQNAGRRAMVLWDGDWVQTAGQDGRGMAGVRQALAVEVAFAPRECRNQTVRGFVILSLGDDAGAPKLALGTQSWRWGELALR